MMEPVLSPHGGETRLSWGERLKARARELGISDTEVARRLGLTQRRYSGYVNESREPNFSDLLRICAVLCVTPDHVLGVRPLEASEDAQLSALTALRSMPPDIQALALAALEGMAEHAGSSSTSSTPQPKPSSRRGTGTKRTT
jgi:transcriptional regulator with XRE-family HTH domain